MLDFILKSLSQVSEGANPLTRRTKEDKQTPTTTPKESFTTTKSTPGLLWFIPTAPYAQLPDMPPIRFDDMHADLTEITNTDKLCFTGLQVQSMSIIDNRFMFGHNLTVGKKEDKHGQGEDKSGWTFQAGLAPTSSGSFSLTGRYNSEVTSVGASFDTLIGTCGLNVNFSELPEKSHWDLTLITGLFNTFFTYRTQSLLYHSINWATWLCPNLTMGTEIQALPWLPNAPPQSRLKVNFAYSLNKFSHCYLSYATGNLGKSTQDIGIGYVKQLSPIFQLATAYDLSCSQERWKSVGKVGYLLHSEQEKGQGAWSLRAFIDSSLKLAALGETPLKEGINLSYSAKFDYLKNVYDLGVGVTLTSNLRPDQ